MSRQSYSENFPLPLHLTAATFLKSLFSHPTYTLQHFKSSPFYHCSSLILYSSFRLVHPLLFFTHPCSQISLNTGYYSLFLGKSASHASPFSSTLLLFLSPSPLCLPFCPHSPFPLSAVNGSITSLLSMK